MCSQHRGASAAAPESGLEMGGADSVIEHHREMSITHADLFRLLPAAVEHRPYTVAGQTILIATEDGEVEIKFSDEQQRRIASLSLPVTHLRFRFSNVTPASANRFMAQFDRSFQRGGG